MAEIPRYHSNTWLEHDDEDVRAKRIKNYIWDTTGLAWVKLAGNSSGQIQIDPTSWLPSSTVLKHTNITTVAANSQTTVVTYTNTSTTLWLDGIIMSGTTDAEFAFFIASTEQIVYRTAEQGRTIYCKFPTPLKIAASAVIELKVTHYDTAFTADFEGTFIGSRY